ncbi:MAG: ATP-binding protein, partial [Candidatus Thermoplasmatota archaeon]|nr:ATP-binding protein [Candidatus Thermoplasmatota archaeon]
MTGVVQSTESSGRPDNKIYLVFIWVIRLILLASAVMETQTGRWHIFFIDLFAFVLTFLPLGIRLALKISFPRAFETGIYVSILLMVTIEKFMEGNLVFVFLGFLLAIVGFTLMYVMYYHKRPGAVNFMVVLFSFCFSVSLGAVWEVFHYFMTDILKVRLEGFFHDYSPLGLVLIMIGAGTSSVIGYIYLKFSRKYFIQKVLSNFLKKNPNLSIDDESPEYIRKLIEKGESETLEFKTTLRMNLYTKVKDKRIEQAVTKTIVAFLNSQGGTLLVGVSDKG